MVYHLASETRVGRTILILCLRLLVEEKLLLGLYQYIDLRPQSRELPLQVAEYMLRDLDLFLRTLEFVGSNDYELQLQEDVRRRPREMIGVPMQLCVYERYLRVPAAIANYYLRHSKWMIRMS